MNELADYGGEHRIVITREGAMDELIVRVEVKPEAYERGKEYLAQFQALTSSRLQKMLGIRAKIDVVVPGTFPRTDFKARRVVDDRDVFRELNERLAKET